MRNKNYRYRDDMEELSLKKKSNIKQNIWNMLGLIFIILMITSLSLQIYSAIRIEIDKDAMREIFKYQAKHCKSMG